MAYIIITAMLWILFISLAPCREWRRYYPSLVFSGLLAIASDLFGVIWNQWAYQGPIVGGLSLWSVLGIAPAEGGLFIRLFPASEHWYIKTGYLIGWSLLNTVGEWFFVQAGWIQYLQWNSFRAFLFYLFFFGAVWLQEYWYNATGRLRRRE